MDSGHLGVGMEILSNLMMGFSIACTPTNLFLCFVGAMAGTLVGILPGIGPSATIAMLIPITFGMEPTGALIMLSGIYYGAQYGGSTTAILINVPGESGSIMTAVEGYQLALQGRAGPALGMSAISSFIAGTASVVGLMLLAPPLVEVALTFGPPEYFSLMLMGLMTLVFLAGKSMFKALLMGVFGLLLSAIGPDEMVGATRFTYGQVELLPGIDFIVATMGLFAMAEVFLNAEQQLRIKVVKCPSRLSELMPNLQDMRDSLGAFVRGTVIGFLIGVLPGAGTTIAAFLAYAAEVKCSKHPEKFGTGVIEGVAAPEGANNAATAGAMVPMFTLGIPGSPATAIMLGALLLWGIRPGPMLFQQRPDLVWGVIASMYIGNVMLLVLNLPLVPLFASAMRVPYSLVGPLIVVFCIVGAYSLNTSVFDVVLLGIFGLLGYVMKKLDFPAAPVVLAMVLGPMVERSFRQSLTISHGDPTIFFTRPISGILMAVTVLMLVTPLIRRFAAWRTKALEQADDSV